MIMNIIIILIILFGIGGLILALFNLNIAKKLDQKSRIKLLEKSKIRLNIFLILLSILGILTIIATTLALIHLT